MYVYYYFMFFLLCGSVFHVWSLSLDYIPLIFRQNLGSFDYSRLDLMKISNASICINRRKLDLPKMTEIRWTVLKIIQNGIHIFVVFTLWSCLWNVVFEIPFYMCHWKFFADTSLLMINRLILRNCIL